MSEGGIATKCGCNRHMINLTDEKVARYKDQWWSLKCLLMKVDKRMPRIVETFNKLEKEAKAYRKMRAKFIKMKNFLKQMPCVVCGYEAGNRFVHTEERIYCGKCWFNNGGLLK